jgi:pyruvate dehydrogenase E2 component (dihydrolipoamide acetyltransferase)
MYRFRMPSLGADMTAGTLVEWLKQPGDQVKHGDVVAVVETDKGAIEIEIFVNGAMGKQLVTLGTKVPVGTPLAEIEGAKEEEPFTDEIPLELGTAMPAVPTSAPRQAKGPSEEKVIASPAARVRAAELGVALSAVHGSGPNGSIVLHDVEHAAETMPRRGLDLGKMRQAIAAAMSRSKREIPHYYLSHDINVSAAINWLESINSERPPEDRILLAALIQKSTALAVRKYPVFNGFFDSQKGFSPAAKVHIGSAVAIRGGGLVSPAIHNCDELSLDQLMARLSDLASRAREGRLRSSEMSDATITVSNLGERGVQSLYGIIYPPQVAIVGFGTVVRRPAAVENRVELCPLMTATLAADHRVSDGHMGARFLKEIDMRLQEPEKL